MKILLIAIISICVNITKVMMKYKLVQNTYLVFSDFTITLYITHIINEKHLKFQIIGFMNNKLNTTLEHSLDTELVKSYFELITLQ